MIYFMNQFNQECWLFDLKIDELTKIRDEVDDTFFKMKVVVFDSAE